LKKNTPTYWSHISEAFSTLRQGLRITWRHFLGARNSVKPRGPASPDYFSAPDGISTVQYPHASLPVPDNARYRLHNEIDDCIVCDKCAKICPVDCIEIEPVRAVEEIGKTSDGTSKRIYAAKFDIDMAKCCFCGLCTTVCPTECLTMTKAYDFSEFEVHAHTFAFAEMTPLEILEKKQAWEKYNAEKQASTPSPASRPGPARPVVKPATNPPVSGADTESLPEPAAKPKPFIPKIKPVIKPSQAPAKESGNTEENPSASDTPPSPKPARPKPIIPGKKPNSEDSQ
jgi:formate hydrogenlyase subunit 6/NADH:ubiquinone oxidoreductase subunit I